MTEQGDHDSWHKKITILIQEIVLSIRVLRREVDTLEREVGLLKAARDQAPELEWDMGE